MSDDLVARLRASATHEIIDGPTHRLLDEAADALQRGNEDAERYRWLRDGGKEWLTLIKPTIIKVDVAGEDMLAEEKLDAAIDAARKAK